jgi:hypothetical protein
VNTGEVLDVNFATEAWPTWKSTSMHAQHSCSSTIQPSFHNMAARRRTVYLYMLPHCIFPIWLFIYMFSGVIPSCRGMRKVLRILGTIIFVKLFINHVKCGQEDTNKVMRFFKCENCVWYYQNEQYANLLLSGNINDSFWIQKVGWRCTTEHGVIYVFTTDAQR